MEEENEITTRNKSVSFIAATFGYTEIWVRQLAREGRIPGEKIGHTWHFDEIEVYNAIKKKNHYKDKE